MKTGKIVLCFVWAFMCANSLFAVDEAQDLTNLSLEDLMKVEVTSVSRSPEKLSTASAAVSVITSDDIRRSGARSIAEALRFAPGLDVARLDSHQWAISSRGFNDVFANKLLVMIDGRSVYTPLFSGVYWDVQDTILQDVERIEVIRGPGATLWGANAVNGVINIITKAAKDTQGWLASGGGGTEELGFGGIRYGGKLGEDAYVRVYGKYFNRDESKLSSGADAQDRWDMFRGGFRLDWQPADVNLITFQGDVYTGTQAQTYAVPTFAPPFTAIIADDEEVSGGNLLARWSHTFSDESQMSLQAFVDETQRQSVIFREHRDTEDIDFQHQFALGQRQKIIWGGGFRRTADRTRGSTSVFLTPSHRASELLSAFAQDEISVVENRFSVTLGTKFEHNDFTGFEVQPSVRLLWTPRERHAVWTAVSRAVRTPSRAEDDLQINPPGVPPGFATIFGSRGFHSEKLIAYEIGYRVQPLSHLSIDLTAFYNDYDDLRSIEPLVLAPVGPAIAANGLQGETYGFEAAATIQAFDYWRLQSGYSYLQMQLHRHPGSFDFLTERFTESGSPHHQIFLRSSIDLGRYVEFDTTFRYVDNVILRGANIPSYFTMDVRLGWRPNRNWEFAIVGQNLLDDRHPEFAPSFIATQQTELERSVYAKVTWRF